jgi:hypothetical protein
MGVKLGPSHYKRTRTGVGLKTRVLRNTLWPRTEELTGHFRELHNDQLHNLYCVTNILQVIKRRRVRWIGHVACLRETCRNEATFNT